MFYRFFYTISLAFSPLLIIASLAEAQVIEDGSLSTEVSTEDNRNFTIDAGEQRGGNLFHSFTEFSIPSNGSVHFNNALTVENIITRVTGSSVSNIDGSILSNGNANLFLINPNGIIFGENASLNIGGSFIATTAETLVFEDGTEFNTDIATTEALLTVSVPLGLQFGNNSGDIINRSNFSVPNPLDATGQARITKGLATSPNKTLGFLGENITFDGGTVTSSGGNIELGSVADNSSVTLEPISSGWKANYDNVSQFQDIQLDNLASVDASGEGAGNINVAGRNIRLFNGSAITSNTLGALDGGKITIEASNLLEINGSDITGTKLDPLLAAETVGIFLPFPSQISSQTENSGKGADIEIDTPNLKLIDGGAIELQTLGGLPNSPENMGEGGDLSIISSESIILEGTRPLIGLAENVEDNFDSSLSLEIAIDINQASEIGAVSISNADGGNIEIIAKNIQLKDGGVIAVSPFNIGNGGDINIEASGLVEITGVSPRTKTTGSAIASNTFIGGNAGDINLQSDRLIVRDGGSIVSTTLNLNSNAGNINIDASSIEVTGFRAGNQIPSFISAQTVDGNNGGNITIATGDLKISDRSLISVEGSGRGIPGNLKIDANNIELNNFASISAATEFQSGGNIQLNVEENLSLSNNSLISALARGDANGGNVDINVGFLIADPNQNNDILATAVEGNGGNIRLRGDGLFGLIERESRPTNSTNDIDASSEFGEDGAVSFSFPAQEGLFFAAIAPDRLRLTNSNLGNHFCDVSIQSEYYIFGKKGISYQPDVDELKLNTGWSDFRFFDRDSVVTTKSSQQLQSESKVKKIELIQGWTRDERGRIVLTADVSNSSDLSLDSQHFNCNPSNNK